MKVQNCRHTLNASNRAARLSRSLSWLLTIAIVVVSGCSSGSYEHRRRDYQPPYDIDPTDQQSTSGSLWNASANANFLYSDQRALRVGDIVTIEVEEIANAQRASETTTSRQAEMNAAISDFVGLMERLEEVDPNIDSSSLIAASTESSFSGGGETRRSEMLQATVPATVVMVLPNGNLFVEGNRVVVVNNEEHWFYISGVARPIDINDANELSSSRLAEAEIEFTGRGDISDQQHQGWLMRALTYIWPF